MRAVMGPDMSENPYPLLSCLGSCCSSLFVSNRFLYFFNETGAAHRHDGDLDSDDRGGRIVCPDPRLSSRWAGEPT